MEYFYQRNGSDHLLVLFHGTGGNEYQLLPIASRLFPNADVVSFEGNNGTGQERRFFPPLNNGEMDRPAFQSAAQEVKDILDTLKSVYKKVTLLGYSNGANFAIGLLEKAVEIDAAYLLHPADLKYQLDDAHRSTQIIITAGANDYMVAPGQVKQLEQEMRKRYDDVSFLLLDSGHEISEQELMKLSDMIK